MGIVIFDSDPTSQLVVGLPARTLARRQTATARSSVNLNFFLGTSTATTNAHATLLSPPHRPPLSSTILRPDIWDRILHALLILDV